MRETPAAVDVALRALRHRDLSVRELEERLRAKGFGELEREEALETLERTGLLDDARFAESRARSLAARGAGDALDPSRAVRARAWRPTSSRTRSRRSTPERERARAVVARRGRRPEDGALPARQGILGGGRRRASLQRDEREELG